MASEPFDTFMAIARGSTSETEAARCAQLASADALGRIAESLAELVELEREQLTVLVKEEDVKTLEPICIVCHNTLPVALRRVDQGGPGGCGYFCTEVCGWKFAVAVMDKVRAGRIDYPFTYGEEAGEHGQGQPR